jgi:Peptidase family M28
MVKACVMVGLVASAVMWPWNICVSRALPAAQGSRAAADPQDPQEPPGGRPAPKLPALPSGAVTAEDVDQKTLSAIVNELVACGTRNTISSWDGGDRGIGCGRDRIVARFRQIAGATGGRLKVDVDRFEATSPRTNNRPAPLENVVAVLPGSDPAFARTAFVVSGHFDSMPTNVMDPAADAPGADDDASGVAVSLECARLLAGREPDGGYRATLIFAAVSGEEQGLLGSTHLVEYLRDKGYTVGGMLDNDIVGADFAPGAPHRVRLFSAGGTEDADTPSRELARTVEQVDSPAAVRLIFREDRLGRGGDHIPFIEAGLPAVRFTEPLEDYHHEHQTPRVEDGVQYGDLPQYLNFEFLATVVRDNAEVLRELAMAPAPPGDVTLTGAVTPDATASWSAPADAQRSGFEILWRETTAPNWSVFDFVTAGSGYVFKGVSTDNHFFAVRSVGTNGARSLAVPAVPRRRRPPAGPPSSTHQ